MTGDIWVVLVQMEVWQMEGIMSTNEKTVNVRGGYAPLIPRENEHSSQNPQLSDPGGRGSQAKAGLTGK